MSKERRLLSLVNAGHQLNLVNWPLAAVSALFLSLRIFLKLRQRRPLWWDDYVLIISWVMSCNTPRRPQSCNAANTISIETDSSH
jgi:hypothetical protein